MVNIYSSEHFYIISVFSLFFFTILNHFLAKWISKKTFASNLSQILRWLYILRVWLQIHMSLCFINIFHFLLTLEGLPQMLPFSPSLTLLTGSNPSLLIKWSYVIFCFSYHLSTVWRYFTMIYWSTLLVWAYGECLFVSFLNREPDITDGVVC